MKKDMGSDGNQIKKLKKLRKSLYEGADSFSKIANFTINNNNEDSVDAFAQNRLTISVIEEKD